jgi:hypothetical protein
MFIFLERDGTVKIHIRVAAHQLRQDKHQFVIRQHEADANIVTQTGLWRFS